MAGEKFPIHIFKSLVGNEMREIAPVTHAKSVSGTLLGTKTWA